MKKFTLLFTLFILFIGKLANAQNVWVQQSNFPGATRYYGVGFSIGNYGFIGLGGQSTSSLNYDFNKWNQTTNQWSSIPDYPGLGAASGIAVTVEGKAYVGFGRNSSLDVETDLWSYDTTSNTWAPLANLPGPGRYNASCFTLGHKIYVVSGSIGGPPYLNDVWVYDTHANTWTQLNNSPAGNVDHMVAFSIGNHGYIGGGWYGSNAQSAFWQYDTTSDTWTSIASFPITIQADPRAFVIGSKAYVCNGLYGSAYTNTLARGYVYDTVTKAWSVFTNMGANGIERSYTVAFSIGNYGYIGTGMDSLGNLLNNFWQYGDTATGINQLSVNNNHLSIYPNPSGGEITIVSTKNIDELKVFNLLGQLVYISQPKQTQFTFELKDEGMYFVAVTADAETATDKVIISK